MNTWVTQTRPFRSTTPTAIDVKAGFTMFAMCGAAAASAAIACSTEPA